jgi:thiamine-phosphate pyrophosphorylase
MRPVLALLSPPEPQPGEMTALRAMFDAGLARYHLRRPGLDLREVAVWLRALPEHLHRKVYVHAHHAELTGDYHVGGLHVRARDDEAAARITANRHGCALSRSCHTPGEVAACLGRFDDVFFSPVFAAISKPGYGPTPSEHLRDMHALLSARQPWAKRTRVLALGGITADRVQQCLAWGFDGVAVLGAVWTAADPVAAFSALQRACTISLGSSDASTETTSQLEGRS